MKMFSESDIAAMAKEARATPEAVRKFMKFLAERKEEIGEEEYRDFVDFMKKVVDMARADDVSITDMANALSRPKS
jgi:hypothetical protein